MVRVFISYSHDTREHLDRVLNVSSRLRREGVDCRIDQYEESPSEGWPNWCTTQVEEAEFVLVVCTATYERRFRGKEEPRKGLGATWEGLVVTQELYDAQGKNTKFIPVVFTAADSAHIPIILHGATRYDVSKEDDYDLLYRRLTHQPAIVMPKLGRVLDKPPRAAEGALPELSRKQDFREAGAVGQDNKWRIIAGSRSRIRLLAVVILAAVSGYLGLYLTHRKPPKLSPPSAPSALVVTTSVEVPFQDAEGPFPLSTLKYVTPCSAGDAKAYSLTNPAGIPGGPSLKKPWLLPKGERYILETPSNGEYVRLLLEVSVTNRGESGIAKDWRLCLVHDDKPVRYWPEEITTETEHVLKDRVSLADLTFSRPIERGRAVIGWLLFQIPKDVIGNGELNGSIECRDYLEHRYSETFAVIIAPSSRQLPETSRPTGGKALIKPIPLPPVPPAQNCPNGICIGGDNKGNATVNNFAPRSRRPTREQRERLVTALSTQVGTVIVWAVNSDNDGLLLGQDLYDTLKASGWKMEGSGPEAIFQTEPSTADLYVFIHAEPGEQGAFSTQDRATVSLVSALKSLNLSVELGRSAKVPVGVIKIVVNPALARQGS